MDKTSFILIHSKKYGALVSKDSNPSPAGICRWRGVRRHCCHYTGHIL